METFDATAGQVSVTTGLMFGLTALLAPFGGALVDRFGPIVVVRAGHDVESAMAALGITEAGIAAGGDKLMAEIAAAFRAGTARLRGKIMEGALSTDNIAILMKLLEQRQAIQEAQMAEVADEMSNFETCKRILFMLARSMADDAEREKWMALVLRARCEHCGQFPYVPKPTGTSPVTDVPERRLNSHVK